MFLITDYVVYEINDG